MCGIADQSQLVPAVVASQTVVTSGSVTSSGVAFTGTSAVPVMGSQRMHGFSSTPLAEMLRLPVWSYSNGPTVWGGFLLVCGITLAAAIGGAESASRDPGPLGVKWLSAVLLIIVFAGPVIAGGTLGVVAGRRRRQRFEAAAPLRAMMSRLWNVARYCHRDHFVYLPDGRGAPAGDTRTFLTDAARQAIRRTHPPVNGIVPS